MGYPAEDPQAGGQRPRLKFDVIYHDNAFGVPYECQESTSAMLREKGLIQEQAPLPGRFEEIVQLAERHGRDPGTLSFPAAEIRRLMADEDWDFGPNIRARAEHVLATEDLPEYPQEMKDTFARLMAEHGIDAAKFLPRD